MNRNQKQLVAQFVSSSLLRNKNLSSLFQKIQHIEKHGSSDQFYQLLKVLQKNSSTYAAICAENQTQSIQNYLKINLNVHINSKKLEIKQQNNLYKISHDGKDRMCQKLEQALELPKIQMKSQSTMNLQLDIDLNQDFVRNQNYELKYIDILEEDYESNDNIRNLFIMEEDEFGEQPNLF